MKEHIFLGMFFFLYLGVPALLVWGTYCDKCKLDLRDLWMHNHRVDKLAVIIMGTWWVHTCTMILWVLSKTVTTPDYATYMGWALPIILKMYAPQSNITDPPKP